MIKDLAFAYEVEGLTHRERAVLMAIAHSASSERHCVLSMSEIRHRAKYSDVSGAIKSLENKGIIKREKRVVEENGARLASRFYLLWEQEC